MNSRERVNAVFSEGGIPDRMPRWCGMSDEFRKKAKRELGLNDEELLVRFKDDFRRAGSVYRGPLDNLSQGATWRSPFGVEREGIGYGMPLTHPLSEASDPEEIENYPWPDPDWADISGLRKEIEKYGGEYAVLGGEWSPFWHDAIDLAGHENLYFMMYDYPETVELLFERITDYYREASRRAFEEAGDLMDIFFIGNDLGSQTGPLLGVDLFRQFLLPQLKRLIDLGHEYGLKVMMHCCGGYRPLIPDLIAAGMDGLHALQPDCHGMEPASLKGEFGSKIVLNGGIDSHHILINGSSPEQVRRQCREVLEVMAPGGRYIAGASHDTILEETPVENVLAMFDAVDDYGPY